MKKGLMIAVAVAIAAALGVFAQRHLASRNHPASTSPATEVAASAATSSDAAATDPNAPAAEAAAPKVPETLPQFELADRDGKKRTLKEWSGRPLMVNYWATWCGPCRREIPLLNSLRKQRASQRLEIIGIAVDFRDDVLKYAQETTIDYPLLIGEEDGLEAVKAMGMQPAFPFTVFADSKQRIVALKVGELHQDEADLILDRVLAIDAGKTPLATAREEITEGLKQIATRRAAEAGSPAKTD
ncbi:MAG: TlpA disulfide reductase family protein [Steroidobacteraceae bacterium]